ncbi:PTS sugar transporter subunit IIA [Brassicibacter mesophilus]|uniref:PTS sugar transporter subunit IIA n=1 Tax=Brassicibacter mesophilus TaxID=745119 RepID=UPI003D25DC48
MLGFLRKKEIKIYAPMEGVSMDITKVPDAAFSQKMIGDGIGIEPSDGLVVAPCKGRVVQIFPTNHALGIISTDGIEILIHIGLDTVELKGEGFRRLVEVGDEVEIGTPLMEVDLNFIKANNKSTISPIVVTNGDRIKGMKKTQKKVHRGTDIVLEIK